uniref:Uncharacterized protein n=1 Tax=Triticum urartu TaxID=4572 RepID=A0A8R7U4S3_TRIUA
MPPRHHFPHPLNGLVNLIHRTVIPHKRVICHPVWQAPLLHHFIEHLVRTLHAVRLAEAIDIAVVGHDVRLQPLLPHPPEQPPGLIDPSPGGLPAPGPRPDPAVPGNEHGVGVGVRPAARAGALHLVEQEPGLLEPAVPAQRGEQRVVALRVRGAPELARAVEGGEGLPREALLAERADDVGERGGGDERGVLAEEAEERGERAGAGEGERGGAERGLGERDGARVGGVGVGPVEEGEGERGGDPAVVGGGRGGEGPLRAEAARGAREDEARDGGERGGDGGRGEAAEGGGRAERGVEAAALEEGHQELRHQAGRRRGRGSGGG